MDTKDNLIERLKSLAKNNDKRTKASRISDVFDHIEAALAAGVSRVDILSELSSDGLNMSVSTFNTTMSRIRKRRAKVPSQTKPAQPEQAIQNKAQTSNDYKKPNEKPNKVEPSSDPADLDAIWRQTPDLAALAAHHKKTRGNKKPF